MKELLKILVAYLLITAVQCARTNLRIMYTSPLNTLLLLKLLNIIFIYIYIYIYIYISLLDIKKVKQSLYTPWRRRGGEEVELLLIHDLGTRWG
jgi:hypothetical protein